MGFPSNYHGTMVPYFSDREKLIGSHRRLRSVLLSIDRGSLRVTRSNIALLLASSGHMQRATEDSPDPAGAVIDEDRCELDAGAVPARPLSSASP